MMKIHSHIALFLLVLLSLQFFENTALSLWYQLGNDSFTDSFCENIDAPQLECKGSCFINDQLLDQVDSTTLPLEKITAPAEAEIFIIPLTSLYKNNTGLGLNQQIFNYAFVLKESLVSPPSPPPEV